MVNIYDKPSIGLAAIHRKHFLMSVTTCGDIDKINWQLDSIVGNNRKLPVSDDELPAGFRLAERSGESASEHLEAAARNAPFAQRLLCGRPGLLAHCQSGEPEELLHLSAAAE